MNKTVVACKGQNPNVKNLITLRFLNSQHTGPQEQRKNHNILLPETGQQKLYRTYIYNTLMHVILKSSQQLLHK